ncbi:MAG: hypothetical protein IPO87_18290 [Flavobacteriales bacterium]|nr:hypothetical protein [Flavobacteriales bacterium]
MRRPASDLYANRAEQGVRSTTVGCTPSKPTERPITKTDVGRMQPSSNDHFTDRAGNVYRKDESETRINTPTVAGRNCLPTNLR